MHFHCRLITPHCVLIINRNATIHFVESFIIADKLVQSFVIIIRFHTLNGGIINLLQDSQSLIHSPIVIHLFFLLRHFTSFTFGARHQIHSPCATLSSTFLNVIKLIIPITHYPHRRPAYSIIVLIRHSHRDPADCYHEMTIIRKLSRHYHSDRCYFIRMYRFSYRCLRH